MKRFAALLTILFCLNLHAQVIPIVNTNVALLLVNPTNGPSLVASIGADTNGASAAAQTAAQAFATALPINIIGITNHDSRTLTFPSGAFWLFNGPFSFGNTVTFNGNLASVDTSGNITGQTFNGSGANLTGITSNSITSINPSQIYPTISGGGGFIPSPDQTNVLNHGLTNAFAFDAAGSAAAAQGTSFANTFAASNILVSTIIASNSASTNLAITLDVATRAAIGATNAPNLTTNGNGQSLSGITAAQAAAVPATLADAWFARFPTNSLIDQASVRGFVAELQMDGLLPAMVDAAILKTNYAATTGQVITLRGVTNTTASGVTYTPFGMMMNGAVMDWPENIPSTNTFIAVVRPSRLNSGVFDQIIGGLYNGTNNSQEIYYHGDWAGLILQTNGTFSTGTSSNPEFPPAITDLRTGQIGVNFYNRRTIGWSWSNSVVAQYDGIAQITNAMPPLGVSSFSDVHLGGRLAAAGNILPFGYEIQSWIAFNTALTVSQLQQVDKALRWLDDSPVNYVFFGDSLSTPSYGGIWNFGWEYDYMQSQHPGVSTVYYDGYPGISTAVATNVTHLQWSIDMRAPQGKVKATTESIWFGMNDGTSSGSAANLTNMWGRAKGLGDTVWVWSIYNAATNSSYTSYFASTHNTTVSNVNLTIGVNPQLYDHWYAIDQFIGGPFTGPWSNTNNVLPLSGNNGVDGLHFSELGNQLVANWVSQNTPSPICDTNGNIVQSSISVASMAPTNSNGHFSGDFTGTIAGNGNPLTNLNAANLTGTEPLTAVNPSVVTNGPGGISLSNNALNTVSVNGNTNTYVQLNLQNSNAGTNASGDIVITANNGTDTTNYWDMFYNSSTYSAAVHPGLFGGAGDAGLLYGGSNNIIVEALGLSSQTLFVNGGTTNVTMAITNGGVNVAGALTQNGIPVLTNSAAANPNAITNGDLRAITLTNLANVFGAKSVLVTNVGVPQQMILLTNAFYEGQVPQPIGNSSAFMFLRNACFLDYVNGDGFDNFQFNVNAFNNSTGNDVHLTNGLPSMSMIMAAGSLSGTNVMWRYGMATNGSIIWANLLKLDFTGTLSLIGNGQLNAPTNIATTFIVNNLSSTSGSIISGSGAGLTNIPSSGILSSIIVTNLVANQIYTNLYGSSIQIHAQVSLIPGAVLGNTCGFQILSDSAGGANWRTNSDSTIVSATGTLGMTINQDQIGFITTNATFLISNKTSAGTATLKPCEIKL